MKKVLITGGSDNFAVTGTKSPTFTLVGSIRSNLLDELFHTNRE
jgi:hypothetical protein